jgi:hypothetical protein
MEETDPIANQSQCATCGTESTSHVSSSHEVLFDNIDVTTFSFSLLYKCAKSTTGQVIQGLYHMASHLQGVNEYKDDKKETNGQYQEYLYPKIALIAMRVVMEYKKKFINDIINPLQKQVFGANLNGNRNNGQLNKFIVCKGVDKNLRYKYAQFKQLLSLLLYRLTFIANRDADSVNRYNENLDEKMHFVDLQNRVIEFCKFLKENDDSIFNEWNNCLIYAHKVHNIDKKIPIKIFKHTIPKAIKLTADNVSNEEFQNRRQKIIVSSTDEESSSLRRSSNK